MNTVVMTSVLSAGNHALFAGTRILHGQCHCGGQALSMTKDIRPRFYQSSPSTSYILANLGTWDPFPCFASDQQHEYHLFWQ